MAKVSRNLKPHKAPGPDNIISTVLRELRDGQLVNYLKIDS